MIAKITDKVFGHKDGLLIKLGGSSNVLWSKRISSKTLFASLSFTNAIESVNGDYTIGGYSIIASPAFRFLNESRHIRQRYLAE